MHKRRACQLSMLDSPTLFDAIPLVSKNEWVKLAGIIPWMITRKILSDLTEKSHETD